MLELVQSDLVRPLYTQCSFGTNLSPFTGSSCSVAEQLAVKVFQGQSIWWGKRGKAAVAAATRSDIPTTIDRQQMTAAVAGGKLDRNPSGSILCIITFKISVGDQHD